MNASAGGQLIGRWRIVAADPWDRDYLDLVEPAYLTINKNGRGEFAFGAVNATMELEYAKSIVFFTWTGFDEGDEISGSGSAELDDDGAIEIELSFHNGDDAILKARWVRDQFDRGPVVGGLAVAVIAAGLLGLGYWLISEFRAFAALKSVERVQARLAMSSGQDAQSGSALIDDIVASLPSAPTVKATLAIYRDQAQPHHTLEQRVGLISRTVLVPIDHRAEALIRATVIQTVVFTAISPTALIESLLFLARGLRLLRQIAELYGGRPGFAGTVHLMRRLVVGSGTVGAVDLIGNVLAQKLGGAILEKLSSEVAVSVIATQRMARIGILCMQMCRPIPFARDEHPSVSGLIAGALKR
ncbi:MAG TPA: DUF697 domain-containing protein [Pseudolabrys sp.]